ncbi:MAG: sirohydrochlorin cobaltochelatase [Coriobacteriaceae bacterium]|nr:sirohydrochlorin cobaltochelatase [Coriobacteriaceae bacterium]MDD7111168.1 sirohydrochlorin cobaltochelatase [Coriobacteriaceae bacterium]MDY5809237.1 sirohydrochlorin cobaltochelatase [Coriobacteriales bacterium]
MFETALSRRTAIAAGLTAAGASLVAQAGIAQADEAKAPKPVILVVSFGTSYNDSRHITIGAIEDAIRETYPDYDVRRAFTAQIIIDKLAERDGIVIDNFEQAMDKLVEEGVQKVIVQPTHLMAGYEYTDVLNSLQSNYADKFEAIVLGDPLLTSDEDYSEVVEAICDATAEYDDGQTAICFMGHGTEADSNEDYTHLQQVLTDAGHTSYFVGTVEATPTFDDVVEAAQAAGFTKAVLRPLMVVAGDHANNDMADTEDPDSFASKFIAAGFEVECVVEGLGQLVAIDDIYVRHVADAITQL